MRLFGEMRSSGSSWSRPRDRQSRGGMVGHSCTTFRQRNTSNGPRVLMHCGPSLLPPGMGGGDLKCLRLGWRREEIAHGEQRVAIHKDLAFERTVVVEAWVRTWSALRIWASGKLGDGREV